MHKLTPRGGVLFDHRQRVGAASGAEIFRRVQPSSRAALRGLFSYECAIHRTGKRSTTALALVRSTALGGLALGRRSARSLRHCGQRLRKTTAVRLLAAAGTAMRGAVSRPLPRRSGLTDCNACHTDGGNSSSDTAHLNTAAVRRTMRFTPVRQMRPRLSSVCWTSCSAFGPNATASSPANRSQTPSAILRPSTACHEVGPYSMRMAAR